MSTLLFAVAAQLPEGGCRETAGVSPVREAGGRASWTRILEGFLQDEVGVGPDVGQVRLDDPGGMDAIDRCIPWGE